MIYVVVKQTAYFSQEPDAKKCYGFAGVFLSMEKANAFLKVYAKENNLNENELDIRMYNGR